MADLVEDKQYAPIYAYPLLDAELFYNSVRTSLNFLYDHDYFVSKQIIAGLDLLFRVGRVTKVYAPVSYKEAPNSIAIYWNPRITIDSGLLDGLTEEEKKPERKRAKIDNDDSETETESENGEGFYDSESDNNNN